MSLATNEFDFAALRALPDDQAITGYPTEKNFDLLKRIIHASSEPRETL